MGLYCFFIRNRVPIDHRFLSAAAFRRVPDLNFATRRGSTPSTPPVRGLYPLRAGYSRVRNVPNPLSTTFCPLLNISGFGLCKLQGRNNYILRIKRIKSAIFYGGIKGLCLHNHRWQVEFLQQLTRPLFSQVSRTYNQQSPFMLGPML